MNPEVTPLVGGILVGILGYVLVTRGKGSSEKNPFLKILGWILMIAGAIVAIAGSVGFPSFLNGVAVILDWLGAALIWVGGLIHIARDAINQLVTTL
ncbi:MAG: hypothetical protein ABWX90_01095 [Candidatus Saccharimonadales bacterium]